MGNSSILQSRLYQDFPTTSNMTEWAVCSNRLKVEG